MQVSPVTNHYNNTKMSVKPTFTAHYDKYAKGIKNLRGDGIIYQNGDIKNYSHLMRNLVLFQKLPYLLDKKFPNGCRMYDYACSVGYEPASIIISLEDKLPKIKAEKFYPILAFDKNPQIIQEAQRYQLRLNGAERRCFEYFENIKKQKYMTAIGIDFQKQEINNVTDEIRNKIIFREGDIFKDLEEGKLSEEPCVVFIRNTWQFLTQDGSEKLSTTLYDKLKSKSLVFIGDEDIDKFYDMRTDKLLKRAGFNPVEEDFPITFKTPKNMDIYRRLTMFEHKKISQLCYEKP